MIRQVCTLLFKLRGWKFVNNVPDDVRSFIMIGAPHTSNHDFIPAMTVSYLSGRNTKFVIKSEWLKFPFNLIMKPIGAHGIDRSKLKEKDRQSNVDVMAGLFKEFKELVLMIAPEGTRSPNPQWRTGFYYAALKAGVPLVLGYADYEKKEAGLGKVIYPTELDKDMKEIMNFYRAIKGKNPEKFLLDSRYV